MKNTNTFTTLGLLGVMAAVAVAPMTALADGTQKTKNDFRNLGIGAGAVAIYGLTHHNSTATILGAAGAAYSAKRYEDARHKQSQDKARRNQYYRRSNGRRYYTYNGHLYYTQNDQRYFVR